MSYRFHKHLILAFVLVLNIDLSFADVWLYKPIFSLQGIGDDNRNLDEDDEKGTAGFDARGGVQLTRQADASNFFIRGLLNSRRYDGGDDRGRDTDDQLFFSGANWETERSEFSVQGNYLRQSTSITEFEDTGRVRTDERRITRSVRPRYDYLISNNTRVFVAGGYTDVEFPSADPADFNEYDLVRASSGMAYSINELNTITFTGYWQDFDVKKSINETESVGGAIRLDRILSEQWNTYLGFGYRKSNFKFVNDNGATERDDDTGPVYEGGISYQKSELDLFNFTVINTLQPSSEGNVNEQLRFNANYSRQLSPRLIGVVNGFWLENESVNNNDQDDNREAWRASVGLNYRLTESWFLTGRYRHRYQKFVDRDNSSGANSNAILIGIRLDGRNKRI